MGTSFYPQSGVMRRAKVDPTAPAERAVASPAPTPVPAPPRHGAPPPWAGLPQAVGVAPSDSPSAADALLGTLPLYDLARAALGARRRVLDLGCGDGRGTACLTGHYDDVTAVDTSEAAVESARTNAPLARVHCGELGAALELAPAAAPIDGAICIELLSYVAAPEELLAGLRAALAPNGALVYIAERRTTRNQCLTAPLRRAFSQASLTTLLTLSGFETTSWIEAPPAFVSCLARMSSDGGAEWLRHGYAQLAANAIDEALSCFERAEGSARRTIQLEAALGEAECFLSRRKRGAATDALLRARELAPHDARPIAGLARVALSRGDIAQAVELASVAYRIDPTDVAAACAYALVAEKAHASDAKARWVHAANLAPESFDIALRVAHAAAEEQDYAVALWAVTRVRSYGRHYGLPMHVAIATALFGTGRIAEALIEARAAEALAPRDRSVLALLAALR